MTGVMQSMLHPVTLDVIPMGNPISSLLLHGGQTLLAPQSQRAIFKPVSILLPATRRQVCRGEALL